MLDIYISSLAFLGAEPEEMISLAKAEALALEFSSGIPYRMDMEQVYLDADVKKMLHNYFPAPKVPFVLNLASSNSEIRDRSIQHCLRGLNLAKQSGNCFFSAHAGFCIDPDPNELGKKISYESTFNKEEHKLLFLKSVEEVLREAKRLDIQFLIENNVIASFNLTEEKNNPLLCCESEEINWLFNNIDSNRCGLLLDTAHLKVSCKTLGLDINIDLYNIEDNIKAIHHSDNNGLIDNNQPMNEGYWFLPYLKQYSKIPHVIEVREIDLNKIKEQVNLLQKYGC